MRLVLVISSLAAGGAERVLATLANKWAELGHDVTVITDAPQSLDHYRICLDVSRVALNVQSDSTSLRDKLVRNLLRIQLLRKAIKRADPDAVIAFSATVSARALVSCIGTGIPVLISERADPRQYLLPMPWRLLRKAIYPFATAVIVQTESVSDWARKVVPARRVKVIPNPVRPLLARRSRMQVLGPRRTVIAVGRFTVQKGFDLLLEAFARAQLEPAAWQLVILGDGPERAALQKQIAALGINKRVLMPGVVVEPEDWLQHADIFVLSSRFEGFPNALLEAMHCGLPAIAFDCPSGPAEIIQDGVTGRLVERGHVDGLAAAIRQLACDRGLRERMGAAGAESVAERFSLDRVIALWSAAMGDVNKPSATEQK